MKIVVCKLQSLTLLVTKGVVLLVHCIVLNDPIFLLNQDMIYHFAKQHSAAGPAKTYKCKLCHAEFPGFFALRQH